MPEECRITDLRYIIEAAKYLKIATLHPPGFLTSANCMASPGFLAAAKLRKLHIADTKN